MQAMRNDGSGSSLTQWVVGGQCHIISQQTNSKQEEQKDQACFQGFAKLPPGDWWLLFHGRTRFLSPPYFLILIITTKLRQSTLHSRKIKSHTKRRIVQQFTEKYTYSFWRDCGKVQSSTKGKVKLQSQWKKNRDYKWFVSWLQHRAKPIFPNTNRLNVHRLVHILCLLRTLTV